MTERSRFIKDIKTLESLVSDDNCPIHLKHDGRVLVDTVKDPEDFANRKSEIRRKISMYMGLSAYINLSVLEARY